MPYIEVKFQDYNSRSYTYWSDFQEIKHRDIVLVEAQDRESVATVVKVLPEAYKPKRVCKTVLNILVPKYSNEQIIDSLGIQVSEPEIKWSHDDLKTACIIALTSSAIICLGWFTYYITH